MVTNATITRFRGLSNLSSVDNVQVREALRVLDAWAKSLNVEVNMGCEKKTGAWSLGSVATTYNAVTTSAVSPSLKVNGWRTSTWEFSITKANAPTSITFQFQTSYDGGTTWFDSNNDDYSWTVLAAQMPTNLSMTTVLAGGAVQMKATASGTDAVNTITVTGGVTLGG
jgi:hypothetical protein